MALVPWSWNYTLRFKVNSGNGNMGDRGLMFGVVNMGNVELDQVGFIPGSGVTWPCLSGFSDMFLFLVSILQKNLQNTQPTSR